MGSVGVVVAIWLRSLEPTGAEMVEFIKTDPADLMEGDRAHDNLVAARIAGQLYGIDPSVLLGIAAHESRYEPGTVTKEPGHRVSCGVMTPEPKARCEPNELTLTGGYMAGAAHLRHYIDVHHGSLERALVAYAGGSVSVFNPKRGWRAWRAKRWVVRRANQIRRPNS